MLNQIGILIQVIRRYSINRLSLLFRQVTHRLMLNGTLMLTGMLRVAMQRLKNKPTIPSSYAPTNAEQNVQSNWNATSGDARILNKPTTITTAQSAKLTGIDADADMTDVANVLSSLQATNAGQKESARVALEVAKVRFVFNENGTYSLPTGNNAPQGITYISSIDEVWVVDNTDDIIYRLSTTGASLGTYSLPSWE